MQTRRTVVASLAGAFATLGGSPAVRAANDGLPSATVVPGKPPILDFGDGVKVPCDKGALLTLWEGNTFWLTFGFGISPRPERAKGEAVHHAIGAMKYLLLTRAFAPDRLQKVEGGGWRQKIEDPTNYVTGELELPGHPGMPMTDAFRGFGNADQANLGGAANATDVGVGPSTAMPGSGDNGLSGFDPAMMFNKVNAFCSYVVKKADLSLDDVRQRAKFVEL